MVDEGLMTAWCAREFLVSDDLRWRVCCRRTCCCRAPIWLTMRDFEAKAFGIACAKGVRFGTARMRAATPGRKIRLRNFLHGALWNVADAGYSIGDSVAAEIYCSVQATLDRLNGKFADIIAVSGDPLRDIRNLNECVRNERRRGLPKRNSKARTQKSEVRGQKSEVRSQRSEVRGQK